MAASSKTKTDLATALRRHKQGDLSGAETLYERVLAADPTNAQALQFIGLLREHRGDLVGASEAYRMALRRDPQNVRLLNRLATALGRAERYDEAEIQARAATTAKPRFGPAWGTLGNILEGQGRFDEAAEAFETALRIEPNEPQVHNNLGIVLTRAGRIDAAESHFRRAVELAPGFVDGLTNLGNLLSGEGRFSDALEFLRRALEREPNSIAILINLGGALSELGELGPAQDFFSRALAIDPESHAARLGLISTLSKGRLRRYQPSVDRLLTAAFGWTDVGLDWVARLTAQHLKLKHDLPLGPARMRDFEPDEGLLGRLAGDRLLVAYLGSQINADPAFEILLTKIRGTLAEAVEATVEPALQALAGVLATQCALNEYVFEVDDIESRRVAAWRRELEAADWSAPDPGIQAKLLGFCLYASPRTLACRYRLSAVPLEEWIEPLRVVIDEEIHKRNLEDALAAALPALTPINDEVSRAVGSQYEENPYPRWYTVSRRPPESVADTISRLFPDVEPPNFLHGPASILVAGCGTGQHPITEVAMVHRDASVLAIDLSRASLGHAARRAEELGVGNVEFAIADILELGRLERRFDLIEAGGVLHHMRDPVAGWRVLRDLLRPDGFMVVALYSRRARRHIAAARAELAGRAVDSSDAGIRAFRHEVLYGGADGPFSALLGSFDFYSMSGCRDLVFHVQEHDFTLPEIGEILGRLDLELIGLQHLDPEIPRRYREAFPDDPRMNNLRNWDAFEESNPDTFVQMYYVWCRKPG